MRKPLALATLIAVFALAIVATALAATKTVKVGDNYYVRPSGVPTVTVSKGTRVRWSFQGDNSHDVRVSRGPVRFKSSIKTSGTYTRTMRTRGTYRIYCSVHGVSDQSMKLVVK